MQRRQAFGTRRSLAARYSHIAFNDISCAHHAPAFEIATEYFSTVLLFPYLPASPLDTLPMHFSPFSRFLLCFSLSLSLSSQFISFNLPRFNHFPSLSLSLSTGAKQIAKYPQVVDFSDYVLRIAYHRTCQDEYRQSWMECKWSVCWGEQRRFRWALKLYCSYRGWTSTKFYRVIGFLFYYRGWGCVWT